MNSIQTVLAMELLKILKSDSQILMSGFSTI